MHLARDGLTAWFSDEGESIAPNMKGPGYQTMKSGLLIKLSPLAQRASRSTSCLMVTLTLGL